MSTLRDRVFSRRQLAGMTWLILALWTLAVGASAAWGVRLLHDTMADAAVHDARNSFSKDVIYRKWAASHGGVYVPVTATTPPNQHLADAAERDLVTPSGRRLTLMNPAYIMRQIHELEAKASGTQGHITSLKPLRPENAPDAWETAALQAIERGRDEVISREQLRGEPHLRLMRPLATEHSCLKCHASQGYREGDVRGGVAIAVPLAPYLALASDRSWRIVAGHGALWAMGVVGILLAGRQLRRRLDAQQASEADRERIVQELQAALANVKSLSGMLPICATCKKIRDDKGYWSQVESYVMKHSEAKFTHGICPECIAKHYPDSG